MAADPMGSAVTPTAAAVDLVRAAAAEVLERYRILANTGLTVGMELAALTALEEFLLVAAAAVLPKPATIPEQCP